MRKLVKGLAAFAILVLAALPGLAQPAAVGGEIKVSGDSGSQHLRPAVAFSPAGNSMVVWENFRHGLMARAYGRDGAPLTDELVLVANRNLPGIPDAGEVVLRRDPAALFLPGGELLVFWTEERQHLVLDHFYETRETIDQEVMGQRFTPFGEPLGERFRVNGSAPGFQRRPQVAVKTGGLIAVWEEAAPGQVRDSVAIYGRLLTRRGAPTSEPFRVDDGSSAEVWDVDTAATAGGDFAVVWEAGPAGDTEVVARFYDLLGAPRTAPLRANSATLGRQRRPAVVGTRGGQFFVAWQSYVKGTSIHGILGQLFGADGSRQGGEVEISHGTGEVQISPALALLPSGDIVVAWMDWIETVPQGVFAAVLDARGQLLGGEVKISQERIYPQYRLGIGAGTDGALVVWEGREARRQQVISGRRLKVD